LVGISVIAQEDRLSARVAVPTTAAIFLNIVKLLSDKGKRMNRHKLSIAFSEIKRYNVYI
ncbi:MAG: hypothetical protein IJ779_02205, partial [Ruminococcus sp.]|nr:hypothetical protein [Ruminococcus sp.]